MPISDKQNKFIQEIAPLVQKYAPKFGFNCCSAIIAQAILESGWGESSLAYKYHNYFGMKCGTLWKGPSVNLATKEEYTKGTLTTITDNFRVYDSMEEGVEGYFVFLTSLSRYNNLKGISDPLTYLETIRQDGYATSYSYVQNCMAVVDAHNLRQFDSDQKAGTKKECYTEDELRQLPVNWLYQFKGCSEGDSNHRKILNTFNNSGLCNRYKMTVNDAWCATAVSASFIACGLAGKNNLFDCVECSCEYMVQKAQKLRIWQENDAYIPKTGDVILYDWQDSGNGDCTGWSDHVGIVIRTEGAHVRVLEGNYHDSVADDRALKVNGRYIRGYITPNYAAFASKVQKKDNVPVKTESTGIYEMKFTRELKYGMQGNDVLVLQKMLRGSSFRGSDGKVLTRDGDFGKNTEFALKAFQKKHGLECDGIAGSKTLAKLFNL